MTDERLARLEQENQQRAVENARLATSVEHLSESVRELTATVHTINDTMNKGRGALWIVVGASTLLGGVLSASITKWLAE